MAGTAQGFAAFAFGFQKRGSLVLIALDGFQAFGLVGGLARGFEDTQTVADEAREGIAGSGRAAKEMLHVSGVLIGWGYAVEHRTDSESYTESECKMPEKMGLARYKRKPHLGAEYHDDLNNIVMEILLRRGEKTLDTLRHMPYTLSHNDGAA